MPPKIPERTLALFFLKLSFVGLLCFYTSLCSVNSSTMVTVTEGGRDLSNLPVQPSCSSMVSYMQSSLQHHHRDFMTCPVSPFQWVLLVKMQFCVVLFVPIVSPPVTGYYWEEFGFLLFIPLHQVYSDMDKDPPEPPDLTSSETEQLSHIFTGYIPAWSPLSSCLSVITPTDPTICLNYWSLFSLIQLFNTGKYPQWLSSAI